MVSRNIGLDLLPRPTKKENRQNKKIKLSHMLNAMFESMAKIIKETHTFYVMILCFLSISLFAEMVLL